MPTARNGSVELAYEVDGPGDGEPILLVCGGFAQMIHWPESVVAGLVSRGFRVARFDNRDSGRSTHCSSPYDLSDMASDAVAVMSALGWSSAHVLGVSLGGMIGQVLVVSHPSRVRSLTSVSSAPGWGWRISRPRLSVALKVLALNFKRSAVARTMATYRLLGSARYPFDEAWLSDVTTRALEIDPDPRGGMRQLAAAKASGDRRGSLAAVRVPTLVVHGAEDPVQSVRAGRATADAIPGARLLVLPDAGHVLPVELWPTVLSALVDLCGSREESSS